MPLTASESALLGCPEKLVDESNQMVLPRTPEPEVMDSREEAVDYDTMDHREVNQCFVSDYLAFMAECPDPGITDPGFDHNTSWCLDLGTGTAQIPVLLSRELQRPHMILAADLSWEMLRVAQSNVAAAGCEQSVVPLYCNARRLPFADDCLRQLISNSIIHHIPDPVSVLAEVHRVAAPGAVVFFRDLLRPETERDVEDLVGKWAGDANPHQRQMFRESLHSAFTLEEMRDMLRATGLPPAWVRQTTDRHWTMAGRIPSDS